MPIATGKQCETLWVKKNMGHVGNFEYQEKTKSCTGDADMGRAEVFPGSNFKQNWVIEDVEHKGGGNVQLLSEI